jgi:hypothetical protein
MSVVAHGDMFQRDACSHTLCRHMHTTEAAAPSHHAVQLHYSHSTPTEEDVRVALQTAAGPAAALMHTLLRCWGHSFV